MRRHELDLLSLIAGLLFLVVGIASLAGADVLNVDLRWLWPSLAIFVGLIVLVTLRAGRD